MTIKIIKCTYDEMFKYRYNIVVLNPKDYEKLLKNNNGWCFFTNVIDEDIWNEKFDDADRVFKTLKDCVDYWDSIAPVIVLVGDDFG